MQMNLVAMALPVFSATIALEVAWAWRRGRRVYDFDDSVANLACGVGSLVTGLAFKAGAAWVYFALYERTALLSLTQSAWTTWVLAFIGVDFAYYWWHRLSHRVNFLWAVHVVHHQSEEYNLSVALRQAWLSTLTSLAFYLPLAALGVPPLVFFTQWSISTLYQYWVHTEAVRRCGPLELLFNCPAHHRVHHAVNPRYIDRNHGAILIVWDRLFGTYVDERERPVYGTVKGYRSRDAIYANFEDWVRLWRVARTLERPLDRLLLWFRPPEWVPASAGAPTTADLERAKYTTAPSARVRVGVGMNFALVALAIAWLLFAEAQLATWTVAAVGLWILATTWVWAGLLEGRAWAAPLECARALATLGLCVVLWRAELLVGPVALASVLLTFASLGALVARRTALLSA